jgi:EAL domain-containing protein (putative c-di-GMP-specific phosphodiesterase class I)
VPEAIERLEVRRRENGLDADRILVELTESRPVGDLPALRAAIERMRKAGYGLAIDDVGPAVPNYAAMIEMPFTALKLDKVIVQQACGNDNVRSFVSNTIEAARTHGLKVIAEGVEDMKTWNLVRELGADEAQGFLISRPLPLAALPLWLKAWRRRSRSS